LDWATHAARILKNLARKVRFTRAHPYDLSLDASLRSRLQQKSQPRNARREIFVVACAEIPRALRLCRKLESRARQEQAENGDKIDAAIRAKITTLSTAYTLAEDAVRCELVSPPNSLLTGKLTGNFAESGAPARFSGLVNGRIQ
jgi:hypothetical protein